MDFLQFLAKDGPSLSSYTKVLLYVEVRDNPTTLLALSWYWASGGVGSKDMVVLPYKDSLLLFSTYLQQLVMESLGKEFDLEGNRLWRSAHRTPKQPRSFG
ncbi:glucose-6-phosphate isomerase 1, chloroplastic-like isoform X5 [Camellia sinensis]|uniref:glucose-6-phosphate isomerase 1, chloroplastic-like isoform X5 n=1 Tax=Camellia sinensis TaxID=4442 RepID=UPI001035F5AC|nr:glucose-6-phosphate isomerase 1, chloroplastic-like isoform X5 [Camellia sinensis]XP_028051129.1 glucose-6-phosphate isomerase 1, chloroplastic-like isoform X5 [Camellia sinensis]